MRRVSISYLAFLAIHTGRILAQASFNNKHLIIRLSPSAKLAPRPGWHIGQGLAILSLEISLRRCTDAQSSKLQPAFRRILSAPCFNFIYWHQTKASHFFIMARSSLNAATDRNEELKYGYDCRYSNLLHSDAEICASLKRWTLPAWAEFNNNQKLWQFVATQSSWPWGFRDRALGSALSDKKVQLNDVVWQCGLTRCGLMLGLRCFSGCFGFVVQWDLNPRNRLVIIGRYRATPSDPTLRTCTKFGVEICSQFLW